MLVMIEKEAFHIQNAENLVRAIPVDRHPAMAFTPNQRHDLLVGELVGEGERIDARRHAVLHSLVAQFNDFLDHFPFAETKFSFLDAQLDQGFKFFVVQVVRRKWAFFGEKVRYIL